METTFPKVDSNRWGGRQSSGKGGDKVQLEEAGLVFVGQEEFGSDAAGREELQNGQKDLQDRFGGTTVVQVHVTVQCTHVTGLEVLSPNHPCIENMCRKVGSRRSEGNMLSKREM